MVTKLTQAKQDELNKLGVPELKHQLKYDPLLPSPSPFPLTLPFFLGPTSKKALEVKLN
jgi:hypothetical protein